MKPWICRCGATPQLVTLFCVLGDRDGHGSGDCLPQSGKSNTDGEAQASSSSGQPLHEHHGFSHPKICPKCRGNFEVTTQPLLDNEIYCCELTLECKKCQFKSSSKILKSVQLASTMSNSPGLVVNGFLKCVCRKPGISLICFAVRHSDSTSAIDSYLADKMKMNMIDLNNNNK